MIEIDYELLKQKSVLFVDDDETTCLAMKKMLSSKFKDVNVAKNGVEALEIFEHTKPDIIISDVEMPFMDGLELLEKMKNKDNKVPFIIITGYTDKVHSSNDADFVLIKPFNSKELFSKITSIFKPNNPII